MSHIRLETIELKMTRTFLILGALVTLSSVIGIAEGACRKAQVCDDFGMNCEVRDICDSKLDLPSIDLPPLPSLPSTELKPLPSLHLPPLGTTECEYKQVNGYWQNVCR